MFCVGHADPVLNEGGMEGLSVLLYAMQEYSTLVREWFKPSHDVPKEQLKFHPQTKY